jgi:cyclic pyranopterin phosphate synthase
VAGVTVTRQRPRLLVRISVTDRCQLRCRYCLPPEDNDRLTAGPPLSFEEIANFVACLQQHYRLATVRITGGEPLLRSGISALVAELSSENVSDLAMTTNGQLLADLARPLAAAGLRRVNVSLDSLDPDVFRELSGGGDLERTLSGIDAAVAAGLRPVKLNMVVIRGVNEGEPAGMVWYAVRNGCEVRFLELMPVGAARAGFDQGFVSSAEVLSALARVWHFEARPAEAACTSRCFRVVDESGREGRVGFISPCSSPFCGDCRRLRLTADGHLVGCLARDDSLSVRPLLGSRSAATAEALRGAVETVFSQKRRDLSFCRAEPLVRLGG